MTRRPHEHPGVPGVWRLDVGAPRLERSGAEDRRATIVIATLVGDGDPSVVPPALEPPRFLASVGTE